MVLESMRSPFTVDNHTTFGAASRNRNITAINRAISNRTTSRGWASKKLIGCRRVIDDCCNRYLLPLVVAVMSTMPLLVPLTLLTEPAAFRTLPCTDPSQHIQVVVVSV